jgi:hypothetical protein
MSSNSISNFKKTKTIPHEMEETGNVSREPSISLLVLDSVLLLLLMSQFGRRILKER